MFKFYTESELNELLQKARNEGHYEGERAKQKDLEQKIARLEDLAEDKEREFNIEKEDYIREKDEEIKDLISEHKDELRDKEDENATLQNKLDRAVAEHEARIEGLEKEHLEEIVVIETKYEALTEVNIQLNAANQVSIVASAEKRATEIVNTAERTASVLVAEATKRAAELEKAGQQKALEIVSLHTADLINKSKTINESNVTGLVSLIKAMGEHYPKVAEFQNNNNTNLS